MSESLIDQGLNLMLYGMGTVFVFLTLLVFVTGLMSKLVLKYAPPELEGKSQGIEPRIITIIEAAIKQHKKK